jgi:hypothetical protein
LSRDVNVGITRDEDDCGKQTSNVILLTLFSIMIVCKIGLRVGFTSMLQESHLKDSDRWPGQELGISSHLGRIVSKVFRICSGVSGTRCSV